MLAVVFAIDLKTPEALVLAILLDVPIVLSAFAGSRSLTTALVIVSLLANVVAAYVNGLGANHWDNIAIGNRFLTALSIVLVGWLGTTLQERARRFGELGAQEARARREATLRTALERVRATLSHDLVLRAVTREALALFDAASARWIPADRTESALLARRGDNEVTLDGSPTSAEVISQARRALDDDEVLAISADDPVGGLVVDRIGARTALAIPFVERGSALGLLLVADPGSDVLVDETTRAVARAYARGGTAALAQARLFAQLAERNDAIAERGAVIRDLVYALSHDLRTPLAALGLTFRQANEGLYGLMPPTYTEIINRSIVATDELQRLADTLLLVARFESGERYPRREPIDVDALLREVTGELAPIASARNVRLRTDAATGVHVDGDRSDVRRAVTNLVANALEHTPADGGVDVAARVAPGRVEISVRDDGPGVAPELRATLFERFAGGRARRGGGSGLGLYIVRRVAEETGGSASYAPREPHGSIFTISVPLAR